MTDTVLILCFAVMALALALSMVLLVVPLLLWRVLRQADEVAGLEAKMVTVSAAAQKLQEDVDKLDAVLDGVLSQARVQ